MKVLIVEDDPVLSENLKKSLRSEGFAAEDVRTREEAQVAIEVNEYDCVILDITLPDGSGFDLLRDMRTGENRTPVIIVTARGQTEDRIRGLNTGADDYVPKPVDTNELIARVRAVIRRNSTTQLPVITVGSLKVKPAEQYAAVSGHALDLAAKEFAVLEFMAVHKNQIITRTMLMEHIWGSDFDTFSNVVDVYIRNIRRELQKHTDAHLIRTVRGKGYILSHHER